MQNRIKSPKFKDPDSFESLLSKPVQTIAESESFTLSPEKEKKGLNLAEILTPATKSAKKKTTISSIYDRAKEFTSKKEQKCEALFNSLHPFKPTINHLSEKIIKTAKNEGVDLRQSKKLKNSTPQPGPEEEQKSVKIPLKVFKEKYESMISRTKSVKQEIYVDKLDRLDENCTFKPAINSKSFISENPGLDIYSRTVRDLAKKTEKIEQLQIMKEIDELNQCTFSPRIIRDFERSPRPSEFQTRGHVRGYSRGSRSALRSNYNASLNDFSFEKIS